MGEQQSVGFVPTHKKQHEPARDTNSIPPAEPVAGASGEHASDTATDQDVALRLNEKRATQTRNENQGE